MLYTRNSTSPVPSFPKGTPLAEKEGNIFTVIMDRNTILILLESVVKPIFRSEVVLQRLPLDYTGDSINSRLHYE